MTGPKRKALATGFVVTFLAISATAFAQHGPQGRGRGGPGFRGGQQDAQFQADREMFHYLLANHDKIQREVTNLANGVETLTESDDTQVAKIIQKHVASMYERVDVGRPIHRRDPLFDALFRSASKISMRTEKTKRGIRVIETSDDPYVVSLIQAHAQVVSLFVKNSFAEVHKNHAVPKDEQ